jgi:membrane fusion protein (multidrug efflux system)
LGISRWPFGQARVVAIVLACLATIGCQESNVYAPPPPPQVTVARPVQRSIKTYSEFTGTTQAVETVDLRARVKGFLTEVKFEGAQDVKAGDLLFVIDEKPFITRRDAAKAMLDEAESALKKAQDSKSREIAQATLALDTASAELARIEESRQAELLRRNATSKNDYDTARANYDRAVAQVDADKASLDQAKADYQTNVLAAQSKVASAKSDLESAELDLGYCRITAPIDGRITRKLVDKGNLVGDGVATVLATIVQQNPMYAYCTVSEADLLRFREMIHAGTRLDFRKSVIPMDLKLANESDWAHHGRVDYADPGINAGTGTILARGLFPNDDNSLVPGLFVRLRVPFETRDAALLVPEEAISSDPTGKYLLLVDGKHNVSQRRVDAGALIDGMREITSGLSAGDLVVVNGIQRARPGQKVDPQMTKTPPTATDAPAEQPAGSRTAPPKSDG